MRNVRGVLETGHQRVEEVGTVGESEVAVERRRRGVHVTRETGDDDVEGRNEMRDCGIELGKGTRPAMDQEERNGGGRGGPEVDEMECVWETIVVRDFGSELWILVQIVDIVTDVEVRLGTQR